MSLEPKGKNRRLAAKTPAATTGCAPRINVSANWEQRFVSNPILIAWPEKRKRKIANSMEILGDQGEQDWQTFLDDQGDIAQNQE